MIGFEIFMVGLLGISIFTSLVTEAVKKVLTEHNIKYRANTLVGIVATLLSIAVGTGYIILAGIDLTTELGVCFVTLVFMSWLCAMVGYDKVVQAISQFNTSKEN